MEWIQSVVPAASRIIEELQFEGFAKGLIGITVLALAMLLLGFWLGLVVGKRKATKQILTLLGALVRVKPSESAASSLESRFRSGSPSGSASSPLEQKRNW